jgi:hypothetical protein
MFSVRHLLHPTFIIAVCTVSSLAQAQARTLFIDLNNAEPEIAAIKRSNGMKEQDVVVVPSYTRISRKERLGVIKAQRDVDRFTEEAQSCAVGEKKGPACKTVFDRIRAAEQHRLFLIRDYAAQDLINDLEHLAATEPVYSFDMVVISGHHEQGYYRGELALIEVNQLQELVRNLPRLFGGVDTVLLLGCSTGTRDYYADVLAPMFPNVQLIVGAEDNAPLRDEPRNIAFIHKVMAERDALLNAKTPKQVNAIYAQFLRKRWPASLLWRQELVFLKDGKQPLYPTPNGTS